GGDDLDGVRLVINDQHAQAVECRRAVESGPPPRGRVTAGVPDRLHQDAHERELDGKGRAPPGAGACGLDSAAVQRYQVAGDGEAQAQPPAGPLRAAVGLAETLEHMRQELRRDPYPGVTHPDFDMGVDALKADLNLPAPGGEPDRVREEVPDHLLQADGIAQHRARVRTERQSDPDLSGVSRRAEGVTGGDDHRQEIDLVDVEAQIAGN